MDLPRAMGHPASDLQAMLFIAEGDHGIHAHGAARGHVSGKGCYGSETNGDSHQCRRVIRRNTEQHVPEEARSHECAGYSKSQAYERQEQGFAEDHPQNCTS